MANAEGPDTPPTSPLGWIPVDTASQWFVLRGNPASLLFRGKGTCTLNTALCALIKQIATKRGLKSKTPWGFTVARDPVTLNPVIIPVDKGDPQGMEFRWYNASRRATVHMGKVFMAMHLALTPATKGGLDIPVELVKDPVTDAPGLMLQVDHCTNRTAKPRKAAGPAATARLQAAAGQAPGQP